MKNFGAILFFLATAGSFVAGTPTFHNERRSLLSTPVDITARALELVPRIRVNSRASNETENAARSLEARNHANSTETAAENKARALLFARNHANANSSDENAARSLVARADMNCTDAENEKRSSSPKLRRGIIGARSHTNETEDA
ncbi:uncharacterized protein F4822DRAFT_347582 [Hypoxylon trugodes]|uniref:uncharacterized protein n=1 Tax=Hypoxylon trugodes TaxID=326681 RepID=UPI00218D3CA6|nr:uncharacterized protein F4822DRAFT_347582 [Hypoxylon trugodes]KAI1385564.1 hypothetical protein F4822DRAFT_347582 [Hypoxylon trugodes]